MSLSSQMPIQCMIVYGAADLDLPSPSEDRSVFPSFRRLIERTLRQHTSDMPLDLTAVARAFYENARGLTERTSDDQTRDIFWGMTKVLAIIPAWATDDGGQPHLSDITGLSFEAGGELIDRRRISTSPEVRSLYLFFVVFRF